MKNRITEHTIAKKKDIRPNPNNWRIHPPQQTESLLSLINSIGYVDELLVIPDPTKEAKYLLVDGEARWSIAEAEDDLPVSVLDLTEDEANMVLATFDPISSFAGSEASKLDDLIKDIDVKGIQDDLQLKMARLFDRVDSVYGLPQTSKSVAENEWEGMPEFDNDDLTSHRQLIVHFHTEQDVHNFEELIGQQLTERTKFIWFPAEEKVKNQGHQRYTTEDES